MKRILTLALALIFALALTGCGVDTADLGANVSDAVAEDEITNLEVVRDENHPRYFDDIDAVETAWEDYIGEQVELDDVTSDIVPVVKIMTNEESELVNYLSINVSYIEDEDYCELDDALELAKDYVDLDVLQDNYELVESKGLEDEDSFKDYLVHYERTTLGDDSLDEDFYMLVEADDADEVMTITLSSEDEATFTGGEFEWVYALTEVDVSSRAMLEEEPADEPETEQATTQQSRSEVTVYTTETGTKYHSYRGCRGLNNANAVYEDTLSHAQARGLQPCKICY